eukprot:2251767-Prymnesium_polylepis.1
MHRRVLVKPERRNMCTFPTKPFTEVTFGTCTVAYVALSIDCITRSRTDQNVISVMSRTASRTGDRQRSTEDTVIPQRTHARQTRQRNATHDPHARSDPHTRSAASTLQSCIVASWEASVRMPPDQFRAIRTAVVQESCRRRQS